MLLSRDNADEMAHAIAHIPTMQGTAQELKAGLLGQHAELQAAGQAFQESLTELHSLQRTQSALHSCNEARTCSMCCTHICLRS